MITKLRFIDSGRLGKEEGTDAGMSLGGENSMDFTGRLGSEEGGSQGVLQRDCEEGEMSGIGEAFVERYENLVQCNFLESMKAVLIRTPDNGGSRISTDYYLL